MGIRRKIAKKRTFSFAIFTAQKYNYFLNLGFMGISSICGAVLWTVKHRFLPIIQAAPVILARCGRDTGMEMV